MAVVTVTTVSACSSAPSDYESEGSSATRAAGIRRVQRLYPSDFRFRRPKSRPADPRMGPGGDDYVAETKPNARFDCEKPKDLFRGFDMESVLRCVKELAVGYRLEYELVREAQPYWKLLTGAIDLSEVPICARETLAVIPVPREIFFFAPDPAFRQQCHSSRLEIEADEVLGKKFSDVFARRLLEVKFPLDQEPKSSEEAERLLLGWALTPFFQRAEDDAKGMGFDSKLVPDAICKACFGEIKRAAPGRRYP